MGGENGILIGRDHAGENFLKKGIDKGAKVCYYNGAGTQRGILVPRKCTPRTKPFDGSAMPLQAAEGLLFYPTIEWRCKGKYTALK